MATPLRGLARTSIITVDETFDIGVDTRIGVDDTDYQPPFRFTGKLDKLTIKLVPPDQKQAKLIEQKSQEAINARQ